MSITLLLYRVLGNVTFLVSPSLISIVRVFMDSTLSALPIRRVILSPIFLSQPMILMTLRVLYVGSESMERRTSPGLTPAALHGPFLKTVVMGAPPIELVKLNPRPRNGWASQDQYP